MNATIYPHWIPVSESEFDALFKEVDYIRDGFANGIIYALRHRRNTTAGFKDNKGQCFVNPEVFKPAAKK